MVGPMSMGVLQYFYSKMYPSMAHILESDCEKTCREDMGYSTTGTEGFLRDQILQGTTSLDWIFLSCLRSAFKPMNFPHNHIDLDIALSGEYELTHQMVLGATTPPIQYLSLWTEFVNGLTQTELRDMIYYFTNSTSCENKIDIRVDPILQLDIRIESCFGTVKIAEKFFKDLESLSKLKMIWTDITQRMDDIQDGNLNTYYVNSNTLDTSDIYRPSYVSRPTWWASLGAPSRSYDTPSLILRSEPIHLSGSGIPRIGETSSERENFHTGMGVSQEDSIIGSFGWHDNGVYDFYGWTDSEMEQIISRAIRSDSHTDLPESEPETVPELMPPYSEAHKEFRRCAHHIPIQFKLECGWTVTIRGSCRSVEDVLYKYCPAIFLTMCQDISMSYVIFEIPLSINKLNLSPHRVNIISERIYGIHVFDSQISIQNDIKKLFGTLLPIDLL
jgi:hypothetical protein